MYYARQINIENQISPFENLLPEYFEEEYIIEGNKDYISFTNEHWDSMKLYLPDIENSIDENANDKELIETVKTYFDQIEDETALKVAKRIIKMFEDFSKYGWKYDEYQYLTDIYSLLAGTEYNYTSINGCVQGEWNILYYPANYTKEQINIIETEYFNTGTEYIVHDEEEKPEKPEDITGYSVYTHGFTDEEQKNELCNAIGCKPCELIMYKIKDEYKITEYIWEEK